MRARRGIAAIEFALWLPLLILMVAGAVDLGWYLWVHEAAQSAAREGARNAAVLTSSPSGSGPATESDIETEAIAHTGDVLTAAGWTCGAGCVITSTWFEDPGTGWYLLTVAVTLPYEAPIGILPRNARSATAEFTVMTQVQP